MRNERERRRLTATRGIPVVSGYEGSVLKVLQISTVSITSGVVGNFFQHYRYACMQEMSARADQPAEGVNRIASFDGGDVRSRAGSIGQLSVMCACDRPR
jgi:hypothetical protein